MAAPGKEELRALELKDTLQAKAQAELEGLTVEERLRHVHEAVEAGPFADAVMRWRKARDLRSGEQQHRRAA